MATKPTNHLTSYFPNSLIREFVLRANQRRLALLLLAVTAATALTTLLVTEPKSSGVLRRRRLSWAYWESGCSFWAVVSLLAYNGVRVDEALAADVADYTYHGGTGCC
jgi:hypothetical protein